MITQEDVNGNKHEIKCSYIIFPTYYKKVVQNLGQLKFKLGKVKITLKVVLKREHDQWSKKSKTGKSKNEKIESNDPFIQGQIWYSLGITCWDRPLRLSLSGLELPPP